MPHILSRRAFLYGWACAPALAARSAPIAPSTTITLFNGRDLEGWYTWLRTTGRDDPKGVFAVRDGLLRVSGEDWGVLSTRAAYRDYRLIVEWKWGGATFGARSDKARDSGILVHATGEDGARGNVWPESIEHQIIEGGCGDFILVAGAGRPTLTAECRVGPDGQYYWSKGSPAVTRDRGRINWWGRDPAWEDRLGFRGRRDVERPTGEWNRSESICAGDSITNVVNGVVVNHGTRSSHTSGRIAIQSEGAELLIRRIELVPPQPA